MDYITLEHGESEMAANVGIRIVKKATEERDVATLNRIVQNKKMPETVKQMARQALESFSTALKPSESFKTPREARHPTPDVKRIKN